MEHGRSQQERCTMKNMNRNMKRNEAEVFIFLESHALDETHKSVRDL